MRPEALLAAWLPGWCLVLAALAWLAVAARLAEPSTGTTAVGSGGLRWILAAVAVLATGLHQWLLSYAFNLGLTAWDLLGLLIALALLLDVLARRWELLPAAGLAAAEVLLGLGGTAAALSGDFAAAPIDPRWMACYPPVLVGLGGLGLLVIAWRWNDARTATAAAVWILGCIASWGIIDGQTRANWWAVGVALSVLAGLVVAAPGLVPRPLAVLAVLVVLLAALEHGGILAPAACALAFAVRGIRARSRMAALPGAIPAAAEGLPYVPKLIAAIAVVGGWLGVAAAFALLGIGAWVSWRRAHPAGPGFTAAKTS